ncbi:hypothetical protein MD484_g606, partial [Candolleomyces efflorescens]
MNSSAATFSAASLNDEATMAEFGGCSAALRVLRVPEYTAEPGRRPMRMEDGCYGAKRFIR